MTAGYPDAVTSARLLEALADHGAAAIELGIPFSDPLADGPALQVASQVALEQGMTVAGVLALARGFRARHATPLVAMTYVNPVLAYGVERFAREAHEAGIDGVIVSDLPPEERADVWDTLAAAGLDTIPLVAPTTARDRLPGVLARAKGFIYCLSRTGVTGDGQAFDLELDALVAAVRQGSGLPVGIGFGVSDAARARFVAERAEAVIVGAAFARVIERARALGSESGGAEAVIAQVGAFAAELATAVAGVTKAV